ncbi:MAG TPA: GxxExxY protein [Hanamia sp.]|nr:GxxExxY protein [Hanamia sp.]
MDFKSDGYRRIAWLHEIYQRCLTIEIKKVGLLFERRTEHVIFYESEDVGTRWADFIVEGKQFNSSRCD